MTRKQLDKLIEQLKTDRILKEFTTPFQSTDIYTQYRILDNKNARLVVMSELVELSTEHGTIQVYIRHLKNIEYHFVTDTIGMVSMTSKHIGRNKDYFTMQSLYITHSKGL